MSVLRSELASLLHGMGGDLVAACNIKGANDRVDAITLLCRDALRASSLCLIDGVPHHFDGRRHIPTSWDAALSALGNTLVDMGVSPTDVRRMSDMPLSVVAERSFRRSPKICFSNGALDLGTMAFMEGFDPSDAVTEGLPYPYDQDAGCPRWLSFLSEVMPDRGARARLQEFLGLCYADRRALSVEKFAVFLGRGANGKSVIREVVAGAMGPENVSGFDAEQLTRPELIPYLAGKRINFASDMRVSAAFDSALKALSSGQEVVGRKIYGEPVTVKAPPLVFSMNALPAFRDRTAAFFRRMMLFRFGVVVPEDRRDPSLASSLLATELPGVFNWIMEGRRRLEASGGRFSPCPGMDADLAEVMGTVGADGAPGPARRWLEGRGLSVWPPDGGMAARMVRVWQSEIRLATRLSPAAITREMAGYGVRRRKSGEIYYEVYETDNRTS